MKLFAVYSGRGFDSLQVHQFTMISLPSAMSIDPGFIYPGTGQKNRRTVIAGREGIKINAHTMIATTTLNKIRSRFPCESGWKKLLSGLGKSGADDDQLTLERVLEINGLEDALWALRSVENINKPTRLFACDCAQRVAHINTDPRVQACIDTARRFANGESTEQEMAAAWAAAMDAAWAAAWSAARAAAMDAAWAAAWSAAWSAARDAAGDAEQKIQTELFIQHFCRE